MEIPGPRAMNSGLIPPSTPRSRTGIASDSAYTADEASPRVSIQTPSRTAYAGRQTFARVSPTMPSLLFDPFPEQEKTGVHPPCFSPVPARMPPVFGITGKSPKNPVITVIYRERISLLSPKNIMPCFHRLFWATASRGDSVSSPASVPCRRPHRRRSVRSPGLARAFRSRPPRMRHRKRFSPQTSRILRGSPPWAREIVWQSAQIIWKFRAIVCAIAGAGTPLRFAYAAPPPGSIRRPAPARDCRRAAAMVGAREGRA